MHRPFSLLVLVLAACAPDAGFDTPLDGAVDEAPPPGQPVVWTTSVVLGDDLELVVTDAAPGDRVRIFASTRGRGAGPCPPALGGACLDLLSPVAITSAAADGTGRADASLTLPRSLPGDTVWLQAVGQGQGRTWTTPVIRRTVHADPPAPLTGLTRPPEEFFQLGRIGVEGTTLFTEVSYSGGCADHEFIAMWGGVFVPGRTYSASIDLLQRPSGDLCDAWITEILTWDLSALRAAAPGTPVMLTVESDTTLFPFPLP